MLDGRPNSAASSVRVVVLTADPAFEQSVRSTFGGTARVELSFAQGSVLDHESKFEAGDASVIIIDLNASNSDEIAALQRLMGRIGGSSTCALPISW
jgi:hypothetical protein